MTTLKEMNWQFLKKFFPALRGTQIRKEIYEILQIVGETLFEYWEHFKRLCASFPNDQISDRLLINTFMKGLFLVIKVQ